MANADYRRLGSAAHWKLKGQKIFTWSSKVDNTGYHHLTINKNIYIGKYPTLEDMAGVLEGLYISNGAREKVENETVVGGVELKAVLESAKTRRIDIVGIGNSNQNHPDNPAHGSKRMGFDGGIPRGLVSKAGLQMYASCLSPVPFAHAPGRGVNMYYQYRSGAAGVDPVEGDWGSTFGAPAALEAYGNTTTSGGLTPWDRGYSYNAADISYTNGDAAAFYVNRPLADDYDNTDFLGVTDELTYRLRYGRFTETGDGQIYPQCRKQADGVIVGSSDVAIPVEEGDAEVSMNTFSDVLVADPTRTELRCRWFKRFEADALRGQSFILSQRVVNNERTAGFSYSTLGALGGKGTRVPLGLMVGDATVEAAAGGPQGANFQQEFFTNVIAEQTGNPIVIIWMCMVGNDQHDDDLVSFGPDPVADSSSDAGVRDNTLGLMNALRTEAVTAGCAAEDVHFVLQRFHRRSDDTIMAQYGEVLKQIARETANTCYVDLAALVSEEEMGTGNYWDSVASDPATDDPHLRSSGYVDLSEKIIEAIMAS